MINTEPPGIDPALNNLIIMRDSIWGIGAGETLGHNQRRQELIIRSWERLANLLGEDQIILEAGLEPPPPTGDEPRTEPEDRPRAQEALRAIIQAADAINNPDTEDPLPYEIFPDELFQEHNLRIRNILQDEWEALAHAAGRHLTAIRLGRAQPVVEFHRIRNVWEALGVAAFHAGSAALDFSLMREWRPSSLTSLADRYRSGDEEAKTAHAALYLIHQEYSGQGEVPGPEIRKYARMMNAWVTRERAKAAAMLDLDPLPIESSDIAHHDIDYDLKSGNE